MVYFRQSCLILFDKRVEIKLDLKPEEKSFFDDFVVITSSFKFLENFFSAIGVN